MKLALWMSAAVACFGQKTMYFEANLGQLREGAEHVQFFTRGGALQTFFTGDETVLAGQPVVRMRFPGASAAAAKLRFTGEGELPGVSAYFIGTDKSKWIGRVPHYARIRAKDVYPGIDLVYYANERNELEYDFVVRPGADPSGIQISFAGTPVTLTGAGDLELSGIVQKKARVRQGGVDVAADYKVDGPRVRLALGGYDAARELVIDPVLVLSQAQYTNGRDIYKATKLDAAGNIYTVGRSNSTNFPLGPFAFRTTQANSEAVIVKFSPAGTLLYATYLGGSDHEEASSLHVAASGAVHVSGGSSSTNFPAVGAGSAAHQAQSVINPFYAVIDPFTGFSNVTLSWSTSVQVGSNTYSSAIVVGADGVGHITGSGNDGLTANVYRFQAGVGNHNTVSITGNAYSTIPLELGMDAAGAVYVAGTTNATDLATLNAVQPSNAFGSKAFVAKIVYTNSIPTIDYLTYAGGSEYTVLAGMAVMPSGKVILAAYGGQFSPTPNGVAYSATTTNLWIYALNPRGASGPVTAAYGTFPFPLADSIASHSDHILTADSKETLYISGSYSDVVTGQFNRRLGRASLRNGVPVKTGLVDIGDGLFTSSVITADRIRLVVAGAHVSGIGQAQTGDALVEVFSQDLHPIIRTNPASLPIQVDSSTTFPSSLEWIEGEEHTLSASNVSSNGTMYAFSSWTEGGAATKTVAPVVHTVYEANFTPVSHFLSVNKGGNGTVTGGAINCGYYSCATFLATNTQVSLTAAPAAGWTFAGWSNGCTGTGACSFTMTAPVTVKALFMPNGFTTRPGGPLSLAVVSKYTVSGTRFWEVSALNLYTSTAIAAKVTAFTLTQTGGTPCAPPVVNIQFAEFGDLAPGSAANKNVLINFAGCAANARFTVNATLSANEGAKTGTVTLLNQFQ